MSLEMGIFFLSSGDKLGQEFAELIEKHNKEFNLNYFTHNTQNAVAAWTVVAEAETDWENLVQFHGRMESLAQSVIAEYPCQYRIMCGG